MQTKITKTIRVSIDVKQHLDEMKGSVSASEFIETMLSYFERTSINGKFKTLELQGIERIIKIIRAIEKDKIDKLLPAPEAHSDELLDRADKQVTQLKAEVERLKQAGAPDVEDRRKLGQVVRLLENAFDQKNFKKAEKGTDYFVAPVYLEMLLYKVKEICS
jgi:predicted CopG family antitoxin